TAALTFEGSNEKVRLLGKFTKAKDGWLMEYDFSSLEPINKGKLEGTTWTSERQTFGGVVEPAGNRQVTFFRGGGLSYVAGKGGEVVGAGEWVMVVLDKPLNNSKKHLVSIHVEGDRLTVTDQSGTVSYVRAK